MGMQDIYLRYTTQQKAAGTNRILFHFLEDYVNKIDLVAPNFQFLYIYNVIKQTIMEVK